MQAPAPYASVLPSSENIFNERFPLFPQRRSPRAGPTPPSVHGISGGFSVNGEVQVGDDPVGPAAGLPGCRRSCGFFTARFRQGGKYLPSCSVQHVFFYQKECSGRERQSVHQASWNHRCEDIVNSKWRKTLWSKGI